MAKVRTTIYLEEDIRDQMNVYAAQQRTSTSKIAEDFFKKILGKTK